MKHIVTLSALMFVAVVFVGCGSATPSSQFPLPNSVENFSEQGSSDSINFQTGQGGEEIADFYRAKFVEQGLTERTLVTVVNDDVTSTVFDGHASGRSIVVQTVNLPNGLVNVNVRLEEI